MLKTKQEIYEYLEELEGYGKDNGHEMTQEDYNILCAEIEMLEWILGEIPAHKSPILQGDIYCSQNAQNVDQINLLQEQVNLLMIQKTKYIFVLV